MSLRFPSTLILLATMLSFSFAYADGEGEATGKTYFKPKFFFSFDNSRTFIRGRNASVIGLKMGMDLQRKFKYGIGFYSLQTDIVDEITIERENKPDTMRRAQLGMSWTAFAFEYIFYRKNKWIFSTPANIGVGQSYYEYFEKDQGSVEAKSGPVLVHEFGVAGEYKMIRWVGLGAGLGYRFLGVQNEQIEQSFDSPFYVFKIKVYLGEVYRTIFPKKEKED